MKQHLQNERYGGGNPRLPTEWILKRDYHGKRFGYMLSTRYVSDMFGAKGSSGRQWQLSVWRNPER